MMVSEYYFHIFVSLLHVEALLALGGTSNAMNILVMTLVMLEGFSNTMNVPTMMVGNPIAWELRNSGILIQGLPT